MKKASTRLLEQETQTPSPAPDLIPAESSTENLHWDWYSKRGHFTSTQSLATIQKQFQQEQRPYIAIVGFRVLGKERLGPNHPVKGQPVAVSIEFINVGKSEALNTIIHRHLLFGAHIADYRSEPADTTRLGTILGQGNHLDTTAVS